MADERNQSGNQPVEGGGLLTSLEIDTIGEILNISMGSAATAVSTMLDKQVIISTPTVEQKKFHAMDYAALEPAMLVKINYVEGLSGSNIMIFRQRDMQIILNLLMGNTDPPSDNFEFDELSMSAACEVMNQMMGASATALSDFLGRPINISTPEPTIITEEKSYSEAVGVEEGDDIIAVSFQITVGDVMDSSFASILSYELVREIVGQVMGETEEPATAPAPAPVPAPAAAPAAPAAQAETPAAPSTPAPMPAPAAPAPQPQAAQNPPADTPPAQPGYGAYGQPPMGQPAYPGYPPYYGYPGYPAYPGYPPASYAGYPQQPGEMAAGSPVLPGAAAQVQQPQFPQFTPAQSAAPNTSGNMDLLMGVSLDVSVEIGKAKRKIREILDFGQGTVIELNKQAGAPVDIVVNGRLLARGDVVVVEDNFGVRITEILGTKELMESLKEEAL